MMGFLVSSLHSCRLCAMARVSLRRTCWSTPRCCRSASFSAYPSFAWLRLFPVVSVWLGRPILSHAHTISAFADLALCDLNSELFVLLEKAIAVDKINGVMYWHEGGVIKQATLTGTYTKDIANSKFNTM